MERALRLVAAIVLAVGVSCSGSDRGSSPVTGRAAEANKGAPPTSGAPTVRTLTILHVNDTHSHLAAIGPKDDSLTGTLGGIAKAATLVSQVRATGANVLFLHAGDFFEGDTFFNALGGTAELQLLEQLGLDALVPGNHELNYGPQQLLAALRGARTNGQLQVVAANADLENAPPLNAYVNPRFVKRVGDVRVGVFGMTNTTDGQMNPYPIRIIGRGLDTEPMITALVGVASDQVSRLRQEGAEVVVCLSHLGNVIDNALAEQLPASNGGIDVIVGGHDHIEVVDSWPRQGVAARPTIVVQAGEYYRKLGQIEVALENGVVTSVQSRLLDAGAAVEAEATVAEQVGALQAQIASGYAPALKVDIFSDPVASAEEDLTKIFPSETRRDTGLGDFVTDALRAWTGADIAATVMGFLEERLWAGPLVADDFFRISPYGYNPNLSPANSEPALHPVNVSTLATGIEMLPVKKFDIVGAQIVYGLEYGLDLEPPGVTNVPPFTLDYYAQVSGLKFEYDRSKLGFFVTGDPADMKLRVETMQVDQCGTGEGPPPCWKPFDPGQPYTLGASFGVIEGLNRIFEGINDTLPPDAQKFPLINDDLGVYPETLTLHWLALLQHAQGRTLTVPDEPRITIAPPP